MYRMRPYDPLAWMKLGTAMHEMTLSAAEAIYRRNMLFLNGKLSTVEIARMVMEKPIAFSQGVEAATTAAMSGAPYSKVAAAAIRPVSARSSANARRLRS